MTDNELNARIAENVFGWWRDEAEYPVMGWHKDDDGLELIEHIPDYCNDIAAAWEVLEKLNGRAVLFPMAVIMNAPGDGISVYARFYGDKLAQAETLPRAICLAALAAMGIPDNA